MQCECEFCILKLVGRCSSDHVVVAITYVIGDLFHDLSFNELCEMNVAIRFARGKYV